MSDRPNHACLVGVYMPLVSGRLSPVSFNEVTISQFSIIIWRNAIAVLLQAEIKCGGSHSASKRQPSCFPGELNLSKLGLYPRTQLSDRQMLPTLCYWEQSSSLCPDSYKLTQAQEVDGPIRMLNSLMPLPTLRNSPLLVQPERWIIALSKVRDPKPSFPAHLAGWPPAWSVSVFLP